MLKAALDATPKRGPIIVTSTIGRPWTPEGFRAQFSVACKKAGIACLTFNDLRGTAVTRLALVGCTEPEIGTITGHSLRDVRWIQKIVGHSKTLHTANEFSRRREFLGNARCR